MLDAFKLAAIDRTKVLTIRESNGISTTCVLCGGPIGPDPEWIVSIVRHGKAHPHCALDDGFEVR